MDIFKDLRIPMPQYFESPSLTRVGRFQRGILTTTLLVLPVLQAIHWGIQEYDMEFRCTICKDGVVETTEQKYTNELSVEYRQKYAPVSPGFFLAFISVMNLLIVCAYMSYVSDRFKTWEDLKTTKRRGKILDELKASVAVFKAYSLQLCVKLASSVAFVLYNCCAYSVVLPSQAEYKKKWTPMHLIFDDELLETVVHCHADRAFQSSMFNIALLTFGTFSSALTFTELIYIWQETKAFKCTSDYYFCTFLLRHNTVTESTKAIIEKELFLEKQRKIMQTLETKMSPDFFPLFSVRTLPYITSNIFLLQKKMKYKTSVKQKHRLELFRTYSRTKKIQLANFQDLFRSGKDARDPKRILVTGDPGIGKTKLVSQLIHQFSHGLFSVESELQSLQFIFHFDFKELDSIDTEDVTLQELLEYSTTSSKLEDIVFQQVLANPEVVFLVFDGLNEWTAKSSTHQTRVSQTNSDKTSVASIVFNLLSGNLLPGCTILVTSRPTILNTDTEEIFAFDRYAELGSFEPDDVNACVQEFFRDNNSLCIYLKHRISKDEKLEALCRVPQNCIFLFRYLDVLASRGTFEQIETLDLPTTSTKLLERVTEAVTAALTHQDYHKALPPEVRDVSNNFPEVLEKLSYLAFLGIVQGRTAFRKEDLSFAELSSLELEILEEAGFLRRLRHTISQTGSYSFSCLSFQEYLAAIRIVQTSTSTSDFRYFLENADENQCHTLQFVAGLCKDGKKGKCVFVSLMQHLTEAIKLISLCSEPVIDNPAVVFLCKCIYENGTQLGDPFAREAISKAKAMAFTNIGTNPQTMTAILHCLKEGMSEGVKKVTFESNAIGNSGFRQVASFICDPTCSLDQVKLTNSGITDDGMLAFLEITARTSFLGIKILGLRGNEITSEGAKYLACVLFNDWCHLEELHLGNNSIGDLGVEHLSEALCGGNSKILTLDLSSNGITHNGIFFLSKALSNPLCCVRRLYLQNNKILDFGMQDLCESLCTGFCNLRVLFASSNSITDEGMAFLEKALGSKSCGLQELYLGYNQVTDKGVKILLQALPNHQYNLKVLSLSNNPITDIGVKMLADALRNSSCNLHRLRISLGRKHADAAAKSSKLQVRYVNAF